MAAAVAAVAMFTAPALADRQWGQGDFYTFATDEAGWSIIEPGQTHRKIYVSADGNSSNSGLSEDSPVDLPTGINMVRRDSSDWLLLKRGDTFDDGIRLRNQFNGESPLHPIVIGAYGTGERPILGGAIRFWQGNGEDPDKLSNIVVRDINFTGGSEGTISILGNTSNVLVENVRTGARGIGIQAFNGSKVERVTIRRTVTIDTHESELSGDPVRDRNSGWYVSGAHHFLVEENVFDHNGWEEGYSGADDMERHPPSMFSHNLYVGPNLRDMTIRDNITSRGASMGFKLVSPGVIEGNVLVANNLAMGINDGSQEDEVEADSGGDFLVLRDNVALHASGKGGNNIGARGWGLTMGEPDTADNGAIERNVEAHSSDINGDKTLSTQDLSNARRFVNNVVHDWEDVPDLDPNPDKPYPDASRTIMSYMASLDKPATLDAFYDAVRAQGGESWDQNFGADAIVRYIQEGFGIYEGGRTEPTTVTFTNAGTDGTRWDNRANWSTNDLPINGDRIDLDGNTVLYTDTLAVNALDLGGGTLKVRGGLLEVTAADGLVAGGGNVEVSQSGQFVANGHNGAQHLGLHLEGGRFRNTGTFGGVYTLAVSGGEAQLLGGDFNADIEVQAGSGIRILGNGGRLGGYGEGSGQLRMYAGGRLDFVFDDDGVTTLQALGDAAGTLAFHADADGQTGAVLGIDVGDLVLSDGLHHFHLVDVDTLFGEFGQFDIAGIGENGIKGVRLLWNQENGDAIVTVAVNDSSINGFEYEAVRVPEPVAALSVLE